MLYASTTNGARNLTTLRECGFRLLCSPTARRTHGFAYALDNGAWSSFQSGVAPDWALFDDAVDELGGGAAFVVAPDIVCGGPASLTLTESWLPKLAGRVALSLVAVQDGMTDDDVRPLLQPGVGVFVGGSSEWKVATMGRWARLCREVGAYCHVGRVNTRGRLRAAMLAGADSCDGTGATKFSIHAERMDSWVRQEPMWRSHVW